MRVLVCGILWVHAAMAAAQAGPASTVPPSTDTSADPVFDSEFGADPTFPAASSEPGTAASPPTSDTDDDDAEPGMEIFEDADTHWLLSVGALITAPIDDDWDEHLASRGYGDPSPTYGADLGVLYRATRWLNVGLRLAARHRYWLHWDRPAATVFGTDVLVSLDARFSAGPVFQLGLHASGGLGLASVSINGERQLRALGRFQGGPVITFKLYGALRAMVRLAYDHARVELADDLRANLGGFTLLVGFEVRE